MPSPFPGMDPYIESPALWSDFHNDLASEIRAQLNRCIQPRYFARLTPYVTYEVVEIGQVQGVRPDVGVWHLQPLSGKPPASVATTYRPSSETHPDVSPLPGRSNQPPRRQPAHAGQRVRDERYGEAPSGSLLRL